MTAPSSATSTTGNPGAHEAIVRVLTGWGLPLADVEHALHNAVTLRRLRPREELFAQGAPLQAVYLLLEGQLFQERLEKNHSGQLRITLRRAVNPGELVAHFDLLYGQDHSTRARALDASLLIAVDAQAMNRLLYRHPQLRRNIAPLELISRLRTVPFFQHLDLTAISYVATDAELVTVKPKELLYSSDDPADRVYIIDHGQIKLTDPNGKTQLMGNGMAVGFLDFIHPNAPLDGERRFEHQAVAVTDGRLFSLSRQALMDLTGLHPERHGLQLRKDCQDMVNDMAVFARFSEEQRRILIGYMSHCYIPIHHLIMQQGEIGDSLWMLMPGGIAILRALVAGEALQPTPINGPNYFGELALRVDRPLDSTIQAEPNSQWLRLHKEDFQAFLKHHGNNLLDKLTLSTEAQRYLGQYQTRLRYAWLDEDEQLITRQRRHWFILVGKGFLPFFLLMSWALLVTAFWPRAWVEIWQLTLVGIPGILFGSLLLWAVIDYINDFMIVTSQRIVRQEKVFMVMEWRKAAFLDDIRNIDVGFSFMGRVLQFGTLTVHTAASEGDIHFDAAPDPIELKNTILEQVNVRKQHQQASSKMIIQNVLEERLGLRVVIPARVYPGNHEEEEDTQGNWLRSAWLRRQYRRLHLDINMRRRDADRIIWRKHWLVLLGRLAVPSGIFLTILVLVLAGHLLPPAFQQVVLAVDVVGIFFGLITLAWAAWNFADWRNDTYEVSDREVADVRKTPLFFAESRRTAPLDEIENIEVNIPSPLHYIMNFGTVRLQTAAADGNFNFDWVPYPREVADELRRRMERYRQAQEIAQARRRNEELPDWFEMYNRLSPDEFNRPTSR
jgi:CRP-like cAMP-binding protein/membrane protein YdbS with pleckstrin-like domain